MKSTVLYTRLFLDSFLDKNNVLTKKKKKISFQSKHKNNHKYIFCQNPNAFKHVQRK
jgi:hypothetical protein